MPSLKLPAKKHDIKTEEEEYQLFREYYTIFFRKTKYKADDMEALADELARDIVYNDGKFTFFEDVESTLEKLKDHYKLGIVSDSWPPLRRVYKNKGLLDFFSCFVISSMYNSRKQK
ncbi:MAG: HAD family hydrolase [Bacteroidales bacterium]|nr:HAD family hydrolase [Bacteroidales bacterium]MCF8386553.1 HAD family hydrolase [Bacteroidales bacterium]MCF8397766.1 HAD family hydrolase [Bacteroidales bacterium]